MKVCLYSPYVPKHFGGGEKFFFDAAKTFEKFGYSVYVAVDAGADDPQKIRQNYERFLDISLENIHFTPSPLRTANFWQKLLWTRRWDVLYYLTDGSVFFSLAKKNILHIQVPFTDNKVGILNRLKLWNWRVKNTNSEFTKKVIERSWKTSVPFVHYPQIVPPVATLSAPKKKIILHVGRFFRSHHSKRQDVLVDIFAKMMKEHPIEAEDWKLVLVGAIEDQEYFDEVQKKAHGLPIELLQLSRAELWKYYQHASIYWHATGFGLDPDKEPAKMEHFGISTVEAMSMGCVPVVIGKAGQIEVVGEKLRDLLWITPEECIDHSIVLMKNSQLLGEKSLLAQEQSKNFGAERFQSTLEKMLK